MWPFKDSPFMRKPLGHRIVIPLFTAAALHLHALAAGAPVVEELQLDPSPSTLASADQVKGSGGISPLAQLAPSGGLNQLLDDSYELSDWPVLRLKPKEDITSLTVGYEFEIELSSSTLTNFVYKGAKYRWQPKLQARHSWEVQGKAPQLRLKKNTRDSDSISFDWSLKSDKTTPSLLAVSNRGQIEKYVNGRWQPATERFRIGTIGTMKIQPHTVNFSWLGTINPFSGNDSKETLSYTGKIPITLSISVAVTEPNSLRVISRRELTYSQTWSWKNAYIERPTSPDTWGFISFIFSRIEL